MMRILCIGECMVEMAPEADGRYRMGFAGDTFNTAWYLRRLAPAEVSVSFMSAVGDDAISGRLETFIRSTGIEPVLSVRPGMTVGLYMIALSDGERSFSYWRSTSAARTLLDGATALPGLGSGDMAYFSGITVAILSPGARDGLAAILSEARDRGVTVAFDPNLRPALWSSTREMCAETTRFAALADMVLPSFDDERQFFDDADVAATADRYATTDDKVVVVKNGAGPIVVRAGAQSTVITPPKAPRIVDTTAAGDSFNAGLLAALSEGASLDEATGRGCAVASRVIAERGALVEI